MLTYLRVRNLAVLRDVEASFGPGLNVLTGETGAGKSILVDAVGLLLGERADPGLVRQGATQAVVEGHLVGLGAACCRALGEAGLPEAGDDSLVIRRELASHGPSRAYLNDRLASLGTLKRVAGGLVALHGQHRHLILATREAQRRLLDAGCLPPAVREELASAWKSLQQAVDAWDAHVSSAGDAQSRLELLRHQLREVETVSPRAGEDDDLRAEIRRLASAEERAALAGALAETLLEAEDALAARLARAAQGVERLAVLDGRVTAAAERLREAVLALEDAAAVVRDARPDQDEDDGRLDAAQSRLAALQGLQRRYGGSLEAVLEFAARVRAQIADLEDHEGTARRLRQAAQRAAAVFHQRALGAAACRSEGAKALARRLAAELPDLALAGARVEITCQDGTPLETDDPAAVRAAGGPFGYGGVEFLFTAHAGEAPRPLGKVASGGELSRLMLGLDLATGSRGGEDGPQTAIFDEVDAGIGGATAGTIGERLARAARRRQVICVTHLPQIAALAQHHLHVRKAVAAGRAVTSVISLKGEERVRELARMLGEGGSPETARRHAEALLAGPTGGGARRRRVAGRSETGHGRRRREPWV